MTIKELAYRYLPPTIRKRYIKNMINVFGKSCLDKNTTMAIWRIAGVLWTYATPEGDLYWISISKNLRKPGRKKHYDR
jgi:hypothetical protein